MARTLTAKRARTILWGKLDWHPAVNAWIAVADGAGMPETIEVLRDGKQSATYRLVGAGPNGESVIAQRVQAAWAVGRTLYERVLRHPSPPRQQGADVAPCLGALQPPERDPHLRNLGILRIVRGHDQEQPGVRPTLVQLTGGVQVARAEAERGRAAAEGAGPGRAHGFQACGDIRVTREIGEDGEIVSRSCGPAHGFRGERW